ncbi:hypothetical protein BH09VER1_BH09VER1_11490 [soil metagenome]
MSPLKFLPHAALTFLLATSLPSHAQTQPNTEFTFGSPKGVEPAFVETPVIQAGTYRKTSTGGGKAQPWLEIEATFNWLPRPGPEVPLYADELTFKYYILLNKATQQDPKGVMLVGTVTHVNVPQGKDLHSVMYVSPRSLERLFDGKVPTTMQQLIRDVGVSISYKGQVVAFSSWKSKTGAWWAEASLGLKPTEGFIVNKSDTPFAPLAWDYYESIKPKASGQ